MHWYWKVRLYNLDGNYAHAVVRTERNTQHIDTIQAFYITMTGCKMLLEGMTDNKDLYIGVTDIHDAFKTLWRPRC